MKYNVADDRNIANVQIDTDVTVQSFLDSFATTIKKSIKHSVTQQSHDTYKFISNGQYGIYIILNLINTFME